MTKELLSRGTQGPSNHLEPEQRAVIFLGAPFNCPDRMLKVLAAEFEETQFLRCLSLADLGKLTRQNRSVPIVILEERDLHALIEQPSPFFSAAGEARLVLAYRNRDVAMVMMDAAEKDQRLAAVSLLPLEVHMEVWISVIRLLLLGVPYIPACLSRTAIAAPSWPEAHVDDAPAPAIPDAADPILTPREMEVLKLAAIGLQNKNIAEKLDLSEHTVKLHMHHVLSKLGVDNRTGATHWYLGQTRRTQADARRD